MTIVFPDLPFAADALEPHISAETLRYHHGKHHKAYVDKLNTAIVGTPYADLTLEDIVRKSSRAADLKIFDNAAQTWNHGFFWHCLQYQGNNLPSAILMKAMFAEFGSLAAMIEALSAKAVAHFGSGWAWLVLDHGALGVICSHDAETPLAMNNQMIPLFTIDVWEHAYYLDHQNEREKYVNAVLHHLVNWAFVNANFARGTLWTYV